MPKYMVEQREALSSGDLQIRSNMAGREELAKENQSPSLSSPVLERSRLGSPTKFKWQVFMFGFGTGKFPTKMELSDIKSRQLRRQTTNTMSDECEEESDCRRSGNRRWWRLIDVLGCGGKYDGEMVVKELKATFPSLRRLTDKDF